MMVRCMFESIQVPTQEVAGGDDTLLHARHLFGCHIQAQVPAAKHNAISRRQDAVELVQR